MLLIGESGVGKSTWINAFANYCKFRSLEEAAKADGVFPIPCTFELRDPHTKEMISISSEGNGIKALSQTTKVGESVTVMPNNYVFQYENAQINLIDTPGLMDTKDTTGHSTDKEHVNNILRLLSTYDEIHAICILLKGSETRLSNTIKYTLTELLSHLDTDAFNNVIFIFTHATNFNPDQTRSILERFLNETKLVLPLNESTIYCFDNGTVNYLAQCKNKIPQTEDVKDDAKRIWTRSAKSTRAIFDYVCSLKPHSLEKIKKIYNAENTIRILSEKVIDTLMCISKDDDYLEQKKKEMEREKARIEDNPANFAPDHLRKLMCVTETKVNCTQLGYRNTVCKSSKCTVVVNGKIHYEQICCAGCTVTSMGWCASMQFWTWCKVCSCHKDNHDWMTTRTELVTETVYRPDPSAISQIVDGNSALREINNVIAEWEKRVKMYKHETEQMLRTCAKLNTFVHQNALMKSDDELSRSLQNQIETYEIAGAHTATAYLKRIQCQYEQFLAMEKSSGDRTHNVHGLILQLYSLPMKGNDLRKAMEVEEKAAHEVEENSRKSNSVMDLSQSKSKDKCITM